MQGSGTFCVEATVTTAVPRNGKLLVLANGAYGRRIAEVARRCGIAHEIQDSGELAPPDPERLEAALKADGAITHVVRAFFQALCELEEEGGIAARYSRYRTNQRVLVEGMQRLSFQPLLATELRSPIITAFLSPTNPAWSFSRFYADLKARGFVIYPGKVTDSDTFRIGTIGDVHAEDMVRLIDAVADAMACCREK